eukprot:GHRR01009215.1.p1 GENE.GHRR01009215.1~~GHRR01009215.1.p1  ORF type:complete len:348 (+),score=71.84 GHRR01009215.1:438-1481(+)
MASHSVHQLFTQTSLDDLTTKQSVIILKDTATVEAALKTLATRRILSAPVVAASAIEPQASCGCLPPLFNHQQEVPPGAHWPQEVPLAGSKQILGFLDVRDVISSFLAELEGTGVENMKMLQLMRLLEEKGQAFATTAIKDLKVFGGDGDFLHVRETKASLQDVVVNGLLQPKERGSHMGKHIVTGTVHRVAIYDAQFRLINIISQTDIIKFLYMNQQDIGDLSKQTAAELGWAQTMVVSVGPEVSAIEAMRLMNERQISAVAVVDGVGKIIGNFSVSEMRWVEMTYNTLVTLCGLHRSWLALLITVHWANGVTTRIMCRIAEQALISVVSARNNQLIMICCDYKNW